MSPHQRPQSREVGEPHELPRGVPAVVAAVALSLSVWGATYFLTDIEQAGPGFGDGRTRSALAGPAPEAAGATGEAAPDGTALYTARCAACHQASGMGLPGVFPPLGGSEWVVGPPERMVGIVLHGLSGPLTVAGTAYSGAMPAFQDQLSDAELAAVLSTVRGSFGNTAGPISAATVGAVRAATADQEGPWAGGAAIDAAFP